MTRSKSCVVTGSAGGIGSGIVDVLIDAGWAVTGLDMAPSAPRPEGFTSLIGDVADPLDHRRAAKLAREQAPLAGWVNCAGYNIFGSVAELSVDDLRRGVDVDLLGVFHGTATAIRERDAQAELAIVNISSIQASAGFPDFAAYAMCKGGIESLTRQVAAEYVGEHVRCNAVAPGLVRSPMTDAQLAQTPAGDDLIWRWSQITPMGRWGEPSDIAYAVEFLLSDRAGYITGAVLPVNGGALALAPGQGRR